VKKAVAACLEPPHRSLWGVRTVSAAGVPTHSAQGALSVGSASGVGRHGSQGGLKCGQCGRWGRPGCPRCSGWVEAWGVRTVGAAGVPTVLGVGGRVGSADGGGGPGAHSAWVPAHGGRGWRGLCR
jgi:hypothetical protein